ncbi:hypothetical protein ACIHIX_24405 [Streptomyces sp. NPDC051913]|uniref:hypothetical protein n=1 Tax=Streptomyces sp. NPDC051913 TaxID=3365676 RepID=UPI0037D3CC82
MDELFAQAGCLVASPYADCRLLPARRDMVSRGWLTAGEIRRIEEPIKIFMTGGTVVVQGRAVTDPEALSQMNWWDYETVIEVPGTAIARLSGGTS